MKLKNKSVLVYGLGVSGLETVKFLKKKKAKIFIYDDKSFIKIEGATWLDSENDMKFLDLAIISPGIGETKLFFRLKAFSVPFYSELKFASQFVKGKIIAVTGTNGKTTTVSLLSEIFKQARISHQLCGNIGTPLISCVDKKSKYYICEVSSFQLENFGDFKTYISVLLNIAPDHLERHRTIQNYKSIKFSIFDNTSKLGCAVINQKLKGESFCKQIKTNIKFFSGENCGDAYIKNGNLIYKKYVVPIEKVRLQGIKNLENILACMIVCKKCKVKFKDLLICLQNFKGLKHRIEFVKQINGVKYINDSKATNPDSVCSALENFDNVILLLGGQDKHLSYSEIFAYKNIKYIIAFGQARQKIYESAINHNIHCVCKCKTLNDAVNYSHIIAQNGDVVLLSPACSSYDEFKNYEHRGEEFVKYVNFLNGSNL